MAPEFHEDVKAISKQADAGNEANADYGVASTTGPAVLPQLPDLTALKEQQEVAQGGDRAAAVSQYDDVTIKDDGTRVGKGQKAPASSDK